MIYNCAVLYKSYDMAFALFTWYKTYTLYI